MRKFLLLALVLLCSTARADVFRFTINSADFNDGSFYVGLYHSTLTHGNPDPDLAIPVLSICIDFTHHVNFGQSFEVHAINLGDYSGPLAQNYWEAGWLALQLANTTDIQTISNIQRAIWLITTPGTDNPYLTTLGSFEWANQAALNYQSVPASMFELYLRSGETGQAQLSVVPEPSTWATIFLGFGVLTLRFAIRNLSA